MQAKSHHTMRSEHRPLILSLGLLAFVACKKEETTEPMPTSPTPSGMQVVQSATDAGYTLELLSASGTLDVGYNDLQLRIKDGQGNAVSNATVSWLPLMTMEMGGNTHQHSCPYSALTATTSGPVGYQGHVVFNMASSAMGTWVITVTYDTGQGARQVDLPVNITTSEGEFRKRYTSAVGTDGTTYLLAMIQPSAPTTGVNTMVVGLYKRVSSMEFPVVDGYTIRVDPRMPGMGNHGAPGNVDLTQGTDGFYHGAVGFSMTGYWKINLVVEQNGSVLCGEPVTTGNEGSSVHFKVNF